MKKSNSLIVLSVIFGILLSSCNHLPVDSSSEDGLDNGRGNGFSAKDDAGNSSKDKEHVEPYEFIITKSYSADGNLDSWTERQNNDEGNEIKFTRFDSDGNVLSWHNSEYDSSSKQVKSVYYDSENNIESWNEHRYDAVNSVSQDYSFYPDGSIKSYDETKSGGKETKHIDYNSDGSIYEGYINRYDDNGNRITAIDLNEEGNVDQWTEYYYEYPGFEPTYSTYNSRGVKVYWNKYILDDNDRIVLLRGYEKDSENEYDSDEESYILIKWVYDEYGNLTEKQESSWYELDRRTCYDADGNEIKIIQYDSSQNILSETENEFDSAGNKIKSTELNKDGDVVCVEEWDTDGNQTKKISYNKDGVIESWVENEYDSSGKRINSVFYDEDGKIKERNVVQYDLSGRMTKSTNYDANGNIKEWYEFGYFDDGNDNNPLNIAKSLQYNSDGVIESGMEVFYNFIGDVSKTIGYKDGAVTGWTEYEYYHKGQYSSKNTLPAHNPVSTLDETNVFITECMYGFLRYEKQYVYCRIPQINISGKDMSAINTTINDDIISISESNPYSIRYSAYVGDDVVSIKLSYNYDSYRNYKIYNISVATGEFISSSELIKMCGLTDSQFFDIVREAYDKYWDRISNILSGDYVSVYEERHQRNYQRISYEYLWPFISQDGDLCAVSRDMLVYGGGDCDNMIINTQTLEIR